MKRFLLKGIVFFVLLLIIAVFLNFRFKHTVHPNDYYRFQYEEIIHRTVNADNVIIGTSHATHGINPEILSETGTSFFNFALNGANPKFYLLWYKNIFKPYYKRPKCVIIAVEWFFFDSKWLSRLYEQDSEYFPQSVFINNYYFGGKEFNKSILINNRYPLLKYLKSPRKLFHYDARPFLISKYKNGYIPYQKTKRRIKEFYPINVNVDENQQKNFEQLIDILKNDGIKIIFINPPAYNTNVERYKNVPIYAYYERLAAKYHIPFINYNLERRSFINSNKLYYSDGGHLNYLGSCEFSKLLMEDFKKILK